MALRPAFSARQFGAVQHAVRRAELERREDGGALLRLGRARSEGRRRERGRGRERANGAEAGACAAGVVRRPAEQLEKRGASDRRRCRANQNCGKLAQTVLVGPNSRMIARVWTVSK
jgi:hypothetical protein